MGKICPICDKECDSLLEYQYGEETKERCSQCKSGGMTTRMVICPLCGEKANLLYEYQIDGETKEYCPECQKADLRKQLKWVNRKKFFKRHWQFWITLTITVIALVIAINSI